MSRRPGDAGVAPDDSRTTPERNVAAARSLGVTASVNPARAQDYPSKPIQLLVTTAAGGALDLIARTTAERLAESMRQPVVLPEYYIRA